MQNQSMNVNDGLWTLYPAKKNRGILWCILLLATFLRFNGLNEPGLWLDEVSYTRAAQKPIISQITNSTETLGGYLSVDPTLSAIPFSLSLKVGFSDFLARFPAAIFGILGVAFIYRMGRTLFGNIVGLLAALLLCTSSFHILYSQEARSYAQFVFFSIASFLFLYQAITRRRLVHWILYVFSTWLGASTNHLMIFTVGTQGFFLVSVSLLHIFRAENRSNVARSCLRLFGGFSLSLVLVFLMRLPWLEDFTERQCYGCDIGSPSSNLELMRPLLDIVREVAGFNPIIILIWVTFCLLGLVFALYYFPTRGILIASWMILSVLATTFGLWFISQFFHPRYVIWGLPAFLLAVACGLVGVGNLVQRYLSNDLAVPSGKVNYAGFLLIGVLIIPLVINGLWQAQNNPAIKRSWPLGQLQEATNYLATEAKIGEVIIGVPNAQHLRFYLQQTRPDLLYLDATSTELPTQLSGRWYVFYGVQTVPERWHTEVTLQEFHDILTVYRPHPCPIEDCLAEASLLLSEVSMANPDSAIKEKVSLMLSGLSNVPIH